MMLADAECIDAHLFCEHRLLDDVPKRLRVGFERAVGAERDVAEGIQTQLKRLRHEYQCWFRYHSRQAWASCGSDCPVMSRSAWNTQPRVC